MLFTGAVFIRFHRALRTRLLQELATVTGKNASFGKIKEVRYFSITLNTKAKRSVGINGNNDYVIALEEFTAVYWYDLQGGKWIKT